ncbi:MAG: hypothetical protein KKC05_02145 [Nanoarchaeota archaeon]|nr:hypothetical protein [Nanoarchaeota archaeon]
MRKGVSPIMASVMLILIATTIAAIVGPWMIDLARTTSNQTSSDTDMQLRCKNTAYDFDTSYEDNGVNWSASSNELKVKITNTGTMNLYNFTFEVTVNSSIIRHYNSTTATQKTMEVPLKPGQSVILQADNTTNIVGSTLNSVKILNDIVCTRVYVEQDL